MKNFKSNYSAFEGCDIHQFSDLELAMVMGGTGEDQVVIFPGDDDDDLDDDGF